MIPPKTTYKTISIVMVINSVDHTLAQSLSCFSGQDFPHQDFELLLVGPAEERPAIAELMEQYTSISIRYLSMTPDSSLGRAFNLGVQNARGDIVLIHQQALFPDQNFLAEHLAAHQMPSNQFLGVFSSVVPDPAVPSYLFNEGLRRANFLPSDIQNSSATDDPILQNLSVSLPRELFLGDGALRFSELDLSRWGVEREFVSQLKSNAIRLARHPHACCLQRSRYSVVAFEDSIRAMTKDIATLSRSNDDFLKECPTVQAFNPSLLQIWREHLVKDEPTITTLREELTAMEGLIARTHAEQVRKQSELAIEKIAECILIFREHLAQSALVELHEDEAVSLRESIETCSEHTEHRTLSTGSSKTPSDEHSKIKAH